VPGSIGWDAAITRIVTWAQFEDLQTKQEFLLMTTHFDHVGKVARVNSAMAIKNWITQTLAVKGMPVVVCGDFNFQPDEEPYGKLISSTEPLLLDARPAEDKRGTFCGFEKGKMNCLIIDYIFHSPQWHVKSFEVLQDNDGTYYPSDHLPVIATMVLTH
jgi:endonuclease/exonuclease/phosphatase family metal-dependent hydrolase